MTDQQPDYRPPGTPPPPVGGAPRGAAPYMPPPARPGAVTAVMWLFGGLAGLMFLGLVVDAIALTQRYAGDDLSSSPGLVVSDVVDLILQGVQVALALAALFLVRGGREIGRLVGVAVAAIALWTGVYFALRIGVLTVSGPGFVDVPFVAGGVLDLGKAVAGGAVLALLVGSAAAGWFRRDRSSAPAGRPAPPYGPEAGGHPPYPG